MIKSDSITNLAKDLIKAQAEMGAVSKDAKNPFFKSSYATLNAVREVALPALLKNKISLLQPTVMVEGKQFVQTTLLHDSGEYLASLS